MEERSGQRLLVVGDGPANVDVLAPSLRFLGYEVDEAAGGRQALAAVRERGHDLVLLDVVLPDLDGFEVLRRLRAGGARVPVVFVTEQASGDDVANGLDLGADDYITKPLRLAEVAARVRAVLRRTAVHRGSEGGTLLCCADLELEPGTYQARRGGRTVDLSPTEYRLLHHLLTNAGRVLTRKQLMEHVWDYGRGNTSVLKSYISYLRRKLDRAGPPLIHTRRGVGYVLRAPEA
ncbi:two-component system OmpR family response regulator [Streptomyces sp. V4I8]|uniref:response regulator transcription factor n=1 Tax=Streptomyces sp. V4I8 TaxID=3156469 RepID=UPI0035179D64